MKKHLFKVVEISKDGREEYSVVMTDIEMRKYLKGKREMNGYIPGIGGSKKYEIFAYYQMPSFM